MEDMIQIPGGADGAYYMVIGFWTLLTVTSVFGLSAGYLTGFINAGYAYMAKMIAATDSQEG